MEHSRENRGTCRNIQSEHKRPGSLLGTILIIVGILWILREIGWQINTWDIGLPEILLIVGVILIVGRRFIGTLLVVLAILLFLPHLIIPGILLFLLFPVLLIVLGVIVITRLL